MAKKEKPVASRRRRTGKRKRLYKSNKKAEHVTKWVNPVEVLILERRVK
jgi:hypothetical protein